MTTLYKKHPPKNPHKKPTVSWQFVQVFIDTIHVHVHKNLSLYKGLKFLHLWLRGIDSGANPFARHTDYILHMYYLSFSNLINIRSLFKIIWLFQVQVRTINYSIYCIYCNYHEKKKISLASLSNLKPNKHTSIIHISRPFMLVHSLLIRQWASKPRSA